MKPVLAALLVLLALPAAAQAAPSWQSYVLAPPDRQVEPVRTLEPQGDVGDPDGLLADGGGVTTLRRAPDAAAPAWPGGTTATASSMAGPNNGNDGRPRDYKPENAIDGVTDTFWNDATPGRYPDVLTITAPQAVSLPGVTLRSNADGVPRDFTVDTWDGSAWVTQATVTGNGDLQRRVAFDAPVRTDRVRLTVTKAQESPRGEYTRVNELYPGIVDPPAAPPSVIVDFGQVVAGYPELSFAGASGNPEVRLAFSESRQYLTDRSDFTRSDFTGGTGTDQHVPAPGGETWVDRKGCQIDGHVCADGLHGFRYMRVTLDVAPGDEAYANPSGEVRLDAVRLRFTPYLGTPGTFAGHFLSSDGELNRIWYAAAYTNELTTDTFRADDVDPRGAATAGLEGKVVLHDGAKRDRDPYVGDLSVQGRTAYLTHFDGDGARNVLEDLAAHQRADGWIPPASINDYTLPLFDYPLWWVTSSWDYVLYTGDLDYARRHWGTLQRVLDGWYPRVTDGNGLLSKGLDGTGGYGDYAFLPRSGEVTYYNANYVTALRDAAAMADAVGADGDATRWRDRAGRVAEAINAHLWDPQAGAYLDSASGPVRHAQDGNSIAVLSGVADDARAGAALDHLRATTARPWGNAFMDNDTLFGDASQRVYAFTSYPEVEARFATGRDDQALEQIRRTWGWMLDRDPGNTFWEGIGPGGSYYEGAYTSLAHGWSTGALPAMTNYVLGVTPTEPGYARFDAIPHPGDLHWAQGRVPTPHGAIDASWSRGDGEFTSTLTVPAQTSATAGVPAPVRTSVWVDGKLAWNGQKAKHGYDARVERGNVLVELGPGRHELRGEVAR